MNDQCCDVKKPKNTLINSLDRLNQKVKRLEDLFILSQTVIIKLERTDDNINQIKEQVPGKSLGNLNLVELFNNVSDDIDNLIDKTGSNLEKINRMIE